MEIGINFRAYESWVSDGAGQTFCIGDAYPVSRGGATFGWVSGPSGTRNRSTSYDVRLAGINQQTNNGTQSVFRLDLDAPGNYEIRLAIGDAVYVQSNEYFELQDNGVTFATISKAAAFPSGGYFYDAEGTLFSAADWPAGNVAINHVFTSTIFNIKVGWPTSASNSSTISHLYVKKLEEAAAIDNVLSMGIAF